MSFLKAILVAWIWAVVCIVFMANGVEISKDTQVLTTAIVIAGALAGGNE